MEALRVPLHTLELSRLTLFNRVFAAAYSCAILTLLYHHGLKLSHCTNVSSFFISLSMLISDLILALMWAATQPYRMRPIHRREFPQNLERFVKESDFPALDVFICTADPFKEPPMSVANTALSVMAYEYPAEKLSVYVSDDGGSQMTLFAFMEAAKFARHWLPFCRKNNIEERSPEAYFALNISGNSEAKKKIKTMYDSMKVRVENVVKTGKVGDEYIAGEEERKVFLQWTDGFTRQNHPTVIQVLLEKGKDKDMTGQLMPNLIYVSREKSRTSPHHFKAGALNVLLRVSAAMTNAPVILTLDCDMHSNDPRTPRRVLCYLLDPQAWSKVGYIQFPQSFKGINKTDIYAGELRRLFVINPVGFDGLAGPNHVGTGCFFCRRVFFGGPSKLLSPEIPELGPCHVVNKPVKSQSIMELAYKVAACNYEYQTKWGSEMGIRYGSLVEDYYTGYRLHCEGWKSIFCNPERPAFLGDAPINLVDVLNQQKRWAIGLLEVLFSKFSPVTFGIRCMGLLMGVGYAQIGSWAIWSIPITIYAFLPQLALLKGISILPMASEPWFPLYVFLFLGAYGQDFLDFVLYGGTFQRWWNDQRIWMIRGLTCYLFGSIEFFLKFLGISTSFNLTNKVLDDEQSKRYDQGVFEFGVPSPMFVPLTTAAIINLVSFFWGLILVFRSKEFEGLLLQIFIAGFVVVNSLPIYGAILWRCDKGRMPISTTIISTILACGLVAVSLSPGD